MNVNKILATRWDVRHPVLACPSDISCNTKPLSVLVVDDDPIIPQAHQILLKL